MRRLVLFLIISCMAQAASAAVTVEERILQKGLFLKTDCESDPADTAYDECKCDADIRYPEIAGLTDAAAQTTLNGKFKQMAELSQCEGVEVKEATPAATDDKNQEKSPSSASHHYEATFQSSGVIAFTFTDWGYTGGAHGNGTIEGVIVDLEKGKMLVLDDIFATKDIASINQSIYETLSAKPEEEVFHEQIESRKGAFIKDGICQGCTLTLTPTGIKVVFQTYEVAPYAAGNMEVPIPDQYIAYPAITAALAEAKKTTPPEKK